MARITVEQVYLVEKYYFMSSAMADYLTNNYPAEYDERPWMEMLLVKYALIVADKMRNEGDSVSGMTDVESLSSCAGRVKNDNT